MGADLTLNVLFLSSFRLPIASSTQYPTAARQPTPHIRAPASRLNLTKSIKSTCISCEETILCALCFGKD